jgi:hypothetical protein
MGVKSSKLKKRPTRRTVAVTKYFSKEFLCPLERVQFSRVDSPGELMSLEEGREYFDSKRGFFGRALMLTESNVVEIQHAGFFKNGLIAFRIRNGAEVKQNEKEAKLK